MPSSDGLALDGLEPPGSEFQQPIFDLDPARFELGKGATDISEESFRFTEADGSMTDPMVLHRSYAWLYSRPGAYEALVHGALKCESPRVVASRLAEWWPKDLGSPRILDIGAGNGVSGQELHGTAGARILVGVDSEPMAKAAALRDRPGLYVDYHDDVIGSLPAVGKHRLNVLTSVGALGSGHIPTRDFLDAWARFNSGSYLVLTVTPEHRELVDVLDSNEFSRHSDILEKDLHFHRYKMGGGAFHYLCYVARKRDPAQP